MPPPSRPPEHRTVQPSQSRNHAPYTVALGVTQALQNPYSHFSMNQFHNPYSAHYANAYMHAQQVARTTAEGYTLSSTYDSRSTSHLPPARGRGGQLSSDRGRGRQPHKPHASSSARQPVSQNGSWYQAGNSRCTHHGCMFTGSPKSVEIHMMDRHLIYPSNWDRERKSSGWDADPSLKGKTIPIQGTSILLNTSEALDAWLAERKRRWPTAQRVEEKQMKMEEAIARGQLPLKSGHTQRMKRQREDGKSFQQNRKRPHKDHDQPDSICTDVLTKVQQSRSAALGHILRDASSKLDEPAPALKASEDSECDSDDDGPEEESSRPTFSHNLSEIQGDEGKLEESQNVPEPGASSARAKVPHLKKREPKLPPRNPFASRPTLLRNLLAPEIRMTVSNLSQAIRFLVDNNFLRGVELEPGQAEQSLIEVLTVEPGTTETRP